VVAAPGLKKEEFHVNVENNLIIIHAETDNSQKPEGSKTLRKEFCYKSFKRVFELPPDVDSDEISASHENGFLTLKMPKSLVTEQIKQRSLQVE
jgi:HSP20 family protein